MQKYSRVLKNINMEVQPGQLIMIIGAVGSGKSSLLKSIMGEMHVTNGSTGNNGKIGYIPQESFLINNTFRENVLFGHEFDEAKYYESLELSQLTPDLKVLKGGEFAEIGEKGLNLSGGQKQRISIARALYADSDIILIDDSLSALDSHVGKNIFYNLIMKKLINKGKTVLMCTHVLDYLSSADRIIYLDNGKIQVFNLLGQLQQEQYFNGQEATLDVSQLSEGMYMIQVFENEQLVFGEKLFVIE